MRPTDDGFLEGNEKRENPHDQTNGARRVRLHEVPTRNLTVRIHHRPHPARRHPDGRLKLLSVAGHQVEDLLPRRASKFLCFPLAGRSHLRVGLPLRATAATKIFLRKLAHVGEAFHIELVDLTLTEGGMQRGKLRLLDSVAR